MRLVVEGECPESTRAQSPSFRTSQALCLSCCESSEARAPFSTTSLTGHTLDPCSSSLLVELALESFELSR